tara:strand:- start:54 stop:362 length:309 start_codon:yes stop_codon:yes gene_type:complete
MDIESKVKEILEDPEKRKEFLQYDEIDSSPKKLIDAPHEIVFTVEANILEQNEKHENVSSKLIHKRNFHMAVPENKDALEYMEGFLQHFEKCLLRTEEEKNG